jgi:hypothetical protein
VYALGVRGVVEGRFIVTLVAGTDYRSAAAYCVVSRHGVRALPLIPESWYAGAEWAPDGHSIFAVSCVGTERSKDCPVVRVDLDGGILQTLPPLPASGFIEPDGRASRRST